MTAIYLMHPRHGVKIATMEMEAQYDENNGWVRFDPDELADDVTDALSDEPAPEPEPSAEEASLPDAEVEVNVFQRRRGRPRLNKSE